MGKYCNFLQNMENYFPKCNLELDFKLADKGILNGLIYTNFFSNHINYIYFLFK